MPIPSKHGVWLIFEAGTHNQLLVDSHPDGFRFHHEAVSALDALALTGKLDTGVEYDIRYFAFGHKGAA